MITLRYDIDDYWYSVFGAITVAALFGFSMLEASDAGAPIAGILLRSGWLRAYNAPVSYRMLKGYISLSHARPRMGYGPFDRSSGYGLVISLDFGLGPQFTGATSGMKLPETGPLAKALVLWSSLLDTHVVEGRVTVPCSVTVVDLPQPDPIGPGPVYSSTMISAPAAIPVGMCAISVVICWTAGEWGALVAIAVGMFSRGFASAVLAGVSISFACPDVGRGLPDGSGYLEDDGEFIVLRGSERAVAAVTGGRFLLRLRSTQTRRALMLSVALMVLQFMVQLAVVPRIGVTGRLVFFASMVVSVAYEWLLAYQMPAVWDTLVFEDLMKAPSAARYVFGTRTTAAAFVARVLNPGDVERNLADIVPDDSPVMRFWRQTVAHVIKESNPTITRAHAVAALRFSAEERQMLDALLGDAEAGLTA